MAAEINGSEAKAIYWLTHSHDWFQRHNEELGGDEKIREMKRLLGLIRSDLGLSPWKNFEDKLTTLKDKYVSLLELHID